MGGTEGAGFVLRGSTENTKSWKRERVLVLTVAINLENNSMVCKVQHESYSNSEIYENRATVTVD